LSRMHIGSVLRTELRLEGLITSRYTHKQMTVRSSSIFVANSFSLILCFGLNQRES
jgi:hypothetical protein